MSSSSQNVIDAKRSSGQARQRSLARRLLSGTAWAFTAKLFGASSALAVNAFLARLLPPEQMGAYFLITSVVLFAAVVAQLGFKQTIVRLLAESMAQGQPGRAGRGLRIAYVAIGLGSLVVGSAYYAGVGDWLAYQVFAMPALAGVTGLATLWLTLLAFQSGIAESFRGLGDVRMAVLLDGVAASVILALIVALLLSLDVRVTLADAVALSVLTVAIVVVGGVLLLRSRRSAFLGAGTIRISTILGISGPLFVTSVLNYLMTNFSLWVVGMFLLASDVALYGAAWKLVMLVAMPLVLVNMSVQPVIAELYAKGEPARLQRALRGTATLAGIPSVVILLVYVFAGDAVLGVIYGPHYRDAALVLAILSLGQLANVWSGSCGLVLAFTGHQRHLMHASILTSFVSVTLVIVGASRWGLIGVAVGFAVGFLVHNLLAWYLVHRLAGIWTHATLRPSFLVLAAKRLHAGYAVSRASR